MPFTNFGAGPAPVSTSVRQLDWHRGGPAHQAVGHFLSQTTAKSADMSNSVAEAEFRHAIFPDRPWEGLGDASEDGQWTVIHFLFGQATLRAQAYEDGVARFVIAAEQKCPRSGKSEDEIWRLTLGGLQKEYSRYCLLQDYHRERMAKTLAIRNSLAHNFYRRRRHLLESNEGRERVICELREADSLFQQERDDVYWNLSMLTGQPPF